MTNDDRSNEDRPGDGRTPDWGTAPGAAAADEPRYGERGDSAPPRYGERSEPSTQRYDHQGGYGQQHDQQGGYGQQHDQQGAPSWNDGRHEQQYGAGSSAGAPAWQAHDDRRAAKKPATVGIVAFVLGLASLVIGVVGGFMIGTALANSDAIKQLVPTDGSTPDQSQLQQSLLNDPTVMSQVGVGGIVAGIAAVLGLWALVQGIIAIATKRGRGWGVFAVVLAVVATIATFGTYLAVAASAALSGAN